MLDNTVESSTTLNALAKEGLIPTIDELVALSPYQTRHIKRFGNYELDLQALLRRSRMILPLRLRLLHKLMS